jgi:hypothetical protein
MDPKVADRFRARLNAPPDPPLEAVRKFLMSYVADRESLAEVDDEIARMTRVNTRTLEAGLAGIDAILANPPEEEGVLARLVGWEAAWVLEDESDAGAVAFLRQLAEMLRRHLAK